MERLGYGQVVGIDSDVGYRVLVTGLSGEILQLRLNEPYRDVSETIGLIFRWHLDSASADDRLNVASQMARSLNVEVQTLDDADLLPASDVLDQLAERGLAFSTDELDGCGRVHVQLSDGEL